MEIHRFRGEPREVGRAHGRRFQQGIRELASLRARLALARMGLESRTELDLLANQHVDVLARTDRDLYLEFIGLCEGSGVSPADMVILNNYTDLRDLTQGDLFPDGDAGCSAIFLPGDPPVIGQTWDMHGSAQHYVEVMEFAVDSAPRCLALADRLLWHGWSQRRWCGGDHQQPQHSGRSARFSLARSCSADAAGIDRCGCSRCSEACGCGQWSSLPSGRSSQFLWG